MQCTIKRSLNVILKNRRNMCKGKLGKNIEYDTKFYHKQVIQGTIYAR